MAKANKCFNLTLMMKIFKDLKIPKGNSVKNKTINNLIDKIFGQQSKAIKETEKQIPASDECEESEESKEYEKSEESEEWKESEKSERSDEKSYQRFLNQPKSEKLKIHPESYATDWHQLTRYSRAQLLAFVYTFDTFSKQPLHQPHSRECMCKLHENYIENPRWAEKCKLEDIKNNKIQDLLKAMWHK